MSLRVDQNKFYIDSSFELHRNIGNTEYEKHTHDFAELVYTYSGKGVHTVDGRDFPVSRGSLLFINYGSEHSFKSSEGLNFVNILIKPEFISEGLKDSQNAFALLELEEFKEFQNIIDRDNCCVEFWGEEQKTFEMLISIIDTEQNSGNSGRSLMLRSALNLLLTFVFRKMALPMKRELAVNSDLLLYIKNNCSEPLRLDEIAYMVGYNPAYFSRIFKEFSGKKFTEYLKIARIEKAKFLLVDTGENISDIALQVGFSDKTKFFKAFKELVGSSPLEYRKSKK
ncbi:MAG: helix-turn-helix domain-containing protein [Clostridia bacterium]|nr:helix-turn-helix domain-containing protein [Clostridia bacterium]